MLQAKNQTNKVTKSTVSQSRYDLNIVGEITGYPQDYDEHFDVFRNAGPEDEIHLHINSPGGSVLTALQYLNTMAGCLGSITAHLEGEAASAATFILLAADKWIIHENSMVMCHNYSAGYWGTGDDPIHQHKAIRDLCHGIMQTYYPGFLTEEELRRITVHNDSIWITGSDTQNRITQYAASLSKKHEEENARARAEKALQALETLEQEGELEALLEQVGYLRV